MRKPTSPPAFVDATTAVGDRMAELLPRLSTLRDDYLHYDDLRHRRPPEGLDLLSWWWLLKLRRSGQRRALPWGGCTLSECDEARALLRRMDRQLGGRLGSDQPFLDEASTRHRLLLSAVREEAVQSSLLEGAATTRRVAKEMLRTGRAPRTTGERMVANNHALLVEIAHRRSDELSVADLLALHTDLVDGVLPADEAGRFRRADERVVVVDHATDTVLHHPPAADTLAEGLHELLAFAHRDEEEGVFLHPVERAAVVHFWFAWLHPFVDGNGRMARALFYWVMLRNGYWLTEFLPVSKQFKAAPAQYGRAFLLTESDGNDLTYFVLHHLRMLGRALDDFDAYVDRKVREMQQVEGSAALRGAFHRRQLALLAHAVANPGFEYTFASHQRSHGVSYPTARADLLRLAEQGLLVSFKRGRAITFAPADDLTERLERLRRGA